MSDVLTDLSAAQPTANANLQPLPRRATSDLSYKFQRLREKLRAAVASGELAGKLPGERQLAKRFNVNAKTLSKALTDLAAEGLLDRSIGRGTYVKGAAPQAAAVAKARWLVLCDPADAASSLVRRLRFANPDVQTWAEPVANLRPSFINPFSAVISLTPNTPEPLLRDLVVRNVNVVAVGYAPRTYSTNVVAADTALGAAHVARALLLAGHRRLAVAEGRGSSVVSHAVRATAARVAPGATVDTIYATEAAVAAEHDVTAIICDSPAAADDAMAALRRCGVAMPGRVSVAAVGVADGDEAAPCTGYFTDEQSVVDAVVHLIHEPPARPAAVWLAGDARDAGTVTGIDLPHEGAHATPHDAPLLRLAARQAVA